VVERQLGACAGADSSSSSSSSSTVSVSADARTMANVGTLDTHRLRYATRGVRLVIPVDDARAVLFVRPQEFPGWANPEPYLRACAAADSGSEAGSESQKFKRKESILDDLGTDAFEVVVAEHDTRRILVHGISRDFSASRLLTAFTPGDGAQKMAHVQGMALAQRPSDGEVLLLICDGSNDRVRRRVRHAAGPVRDAHGDARCEQFEVAVGRGLSRQLQPTATTTTASWQWRPVRQRWQQRPARPRPVDGRDGVRH
jgi:hypothetical protein